MPIRRSHILRVFVVWTFLTWGVLVKNMITSDADLGFRLVHVGLAVVSMTLAAASWPLARRLDANGDRSDERSAVPVVGDDSGRVGLQ